MLDGYFTRSAATPSGSRPSHCCSFVVILRYTTLGRILWTKDLSVTETST